MRILNKIYLLITAQVIAAILGIIGVIIQIIVIDGKSFSIMGLSTEATRYAVYGFYILAGIFEIISIIAAFVILFASSGTADDSFDMEIERDDPFKT